MKSSELQQTLAEYAIPNRRGMYAVYVGDSSDPTHEVKDLLGALKLAERHTETDEVEVWGDDILATGSPSLGLQPYGPH